MNKITAALLASASFFVVATPALAAAPDWTGTTSSWFTAGNWNPAAAPVAGDTVTVTNAGTAQIDGARATGALTSLSVSGGSKVDVQTGSSLSATNITIGNGTAGTLLLSGSTNVTGAIALNSGTIDNRVANGSLSNTVSLTGANTISSTPVGSPLTMTGVISGAGSLTIAGTGQLSLTSDSTYGGGTTISTGATLSLGQGTAAGTVAGNVLDNGTLSLNHSSAFTFNGIVSGTGNLTSVGANTITPVETYTGLTSILTGTLSLTGSASIAASSGVTLSGAHSASLDISGTTAGASIKALTSCSGCTLTDTTQVAGGSVVLGARSLTITAASGSYLGAITGTGGLIVSSGTQTLAGANTYTGGTTIAAGALLTIGAGGTAGSIAGDVANNGTAFAFKRSDAVTFAGVISGTGQFSQLGSGVLTFTGVNTYTGQTVINPGTLALSGTGSVSASSRVRVFGTFDISQTSAGATVQSLDLIPVGTNPFTGVVSLGSQTLTIANAVSEFDGSIQDGGIQAGTGGKVVLLAGNEIFAGTNTYTGSTTISGGTLVLQAAGSIATSSAVADAGTLDISGTTSGATVKTLSGAGTVALGAQTLTLSNASTTFSGVIQNAGATTGTGGGVTLAAGAFTLSGTSTYTGATKVSGGTLNVTGSIASSAVTVASGASLTGTGTVGSTTISAGGILAPGSSAGAVGTLAVNGNLSLASTAVTNVDVSPSAADKVTATGTAAIAGTLNATFATGTYASTQYTLVTSTGALSGTFANYNVTGQPGNFTSALSYNANNVFLNLSAVTFSSGSTTNVNSGTVTVSGNQTTGGLASSGSGGTLALSSGSTLTDNQNSNTTYSGTITGAGSFAKAGTGTLVLDGVNTYTGSTTVSGGVLEIGDAANPGAAINGPVTIASGGTLSGHGTINGSVTVGAGGNFQPGGTIGTINVGSTTFASGSTYTVETNAAGQGNNTIATGAITINSGATLAVTPDAPLTSYGRLTNYTILQAAGGISGTFSSVTSTAASLTPVVAYAPNTVTLTLVRPDLLATVATTTNQTSIGSAIAASSGSAVLTVLAPQSDAAVRTGFNQLSGDIHASLRSAAVEDSRIIRDTVLDHLGKTSDSMTVWGAGFGGYGSISTDGNASGLHHDMAGFIAGADMPLGQGFRLGLAGAYTSNNASVTGKASTASGNSGHVVAYGGWSDGKIDLKLGGDFGFGHVNVTRSLAAFTQTNTDRQNQRLAQVFGDAGYKFETSRAMVEPYVGIASISARTGAFAETGGSTALSGGSRTDTQTYSTVGMRASLAPMSLGESVGAITPHVDMGWQHAFKTFRPGQVETIAGLSQSFTVLGAPLASDAAAVRAGFDIALTPEAVLSLDYDGSFASRVQNNAVRGSLAWRF